MKFLKSSFCIRPKRFNAIDMVFPFDKFIMTMFNSIMFFISHINKTIIASPGIRMNHTIRVHFASNDALKRLFSAIRNDFSIYFTTSLKDTKYRCFPACTTPSFPFNAFGSKVRFINFNISGKGRVLITKNYDTFSKKLNMPVYCVSVESC